MLNYQCFRVNDKFNIVAIFILFAWAVGNTIWFQLYAQNLMDYKPLLCFFLLPAGLFSFFATWNNQSYEKEFEKMTAEETSKWGWITFGVSLFVLCFLAWTFLRT